MTRIDASLTTADQARAVLDVADRRAKPHDRAVEAAVGIGSSILALREELAGVARRPEPAPMRAPLSPYIVSPYIAASAVPVAAVAVIDVSSVQIGMTGAYVALSVAAVVGGLIGWATDRIMRRWSR
jgi:hypothetical protein